MEQEYEEARACCYVNSHLLTNDNHQQPHLILSTAILTCKKEDTNHIMDVTSPYSLPLKLRVEG